MNQDLSVSAFNPEFSFENMNLRLSTNGGNTLMSWVNERGTDLLNIRVEKAPWMTQEEWDKVYPDTSKFDEELLGTSIGTAVLNHNLVIFTHGDDKDRIYVLWYNDDMKTSMTGKLLYEGNLDFNIDYPLETHVSYEADHIQKVYWTDGFNQPRLINIAASNEKLRKWNDISNKINSVFDFIPSVNANVEFKVEKYAEGGGTFAPGVIQYAFTYINKYGQQSNVIAVSPLQYLITGNRGASPEEKVGASFAITIPKQDLNFDFIRLYSIQRTSYNGTPIVKMLDDIPIVDYDSVYPYKEDTIYLDSSNYLLPKDETGKKVKTIAVTNGSYDVTIHEGTAKPASANNAAIYLYVNYDWVREDFQPVLDTILSDDAFANDRTLGRFYKEIKFTQHVCDYIREYYNNPQWELEFSSFVILNQSDVTSIVYDYKTERWYRHSINGGVDEVSEHKVPATYIDNGTTGSTIDPTELLFVGGKEITALTMIDKDGTLFLGNIVQKNTLTNAIQDYFDSIRNTNDAIDITFENTDTKQLTVDASGLYPYNNTMKDNSRKITTFKGGETYRMGFQLQKHTGDWTSPIFIDDYKNDVYPQTTLADTAICNLVRAKATLDVSKFADTIPNFYDIYQSIRPVIVYPGINERTVLCQGVVNPTVFNAQDRIDSSPFAQPSWYFRPYMHQGLIYNNEAETSENVVYTDIAEQSTEPDEWFADKVKECYVHIDYGWEQDLINQATRPFIESYTGKGMFGNGYTTDWSSWTADIGYIPLFQDNTGRWYFAFIGSRPWSYTAYTKPTFSNSYSEVRIENTEGPFKIYDKLKTTGQNHLYYMQAKTDDPEDYVFRFTCMKGMIYATYRKFFEITFHSKGTESADVNIVEEGSVIPFEHYKSLFNQDWIEWSDKNTDAARQIEIQGSRTKYDSVFSTGKSDVNSNTQFFIDHSIVTLNSPDIEFDTQVQSSATDGLKMRIVGMIPLTSTASAHHINANASINMNYNIGPGGFGLRETSYNVLYNNLSEMAGKRLTASYLWNDVSVWNDEGTIKSSSKTYYYLIHPWHRKASLTTDPRGNDASAFLNTKRESNILFSAQSQYFAGNKYVDFPKLDSQIHLTENDEMTNIRLSKQQNTSSSINYYPNIDKVLTNENGYMPLTSEGVTNIPGMASVNSPIQMKYKSTSHAVIALQSSSDTNGMIPILPYISYEKDGQTIEIGKYTNPVGSSATTFWNDTNMFFYQESVDEREDYNFLWLAELYRDIDETNRFGGKTDSALKFNNWLTGGDSISLPKESDTDKTVTLYWTEGDTYYQRYDCLKTYPFTREDPNQIVEILSFMCETHTNIDGRYDKNRGQTDNTNVSPQNFNLLNPVYSQQDNFFTSRKADTEDYTELTYPNQITFTKTKESGAAVDLWTNITLASNLELDGDKGKISKLNRLNDKILCFQDSGIAQVLYNENVQVSTEAGVPIEIANSGKVQGKRYLSDTVGCSNKWSVVNTPAGIYFMDSNEKSIYRIGGEGLQNISQQGGFNTWCKQHIPASKLNWSPLFPTNSNGQSSFVSYYDRQNQDVLFINSKTALAYSEKFGVFTSFYDYGSSPYLCGLDDTSLWVRGDGTIWKHQAGEDYCNFFDENKPYGMTLVGNPEPQIDKIFTNLEFRACVDGDGQLGSNEKFTFSLPFDSFETWDEYQHGYTVLSNKSGHSAMVHGGDDSALKRKFRIWRCDIPRDNYEFLSYPEQEEGETAEHYQNRVNEYKEWLQSEHDKGIFRTGKHPMDRMRNPWLYLKLSKDFDTSKRTEIHDVMLTYFG